MDLNNFLVFDRVQRHQSFTLAAEELALSKGSISQKIKILEQTLDVRLFERSTRKVRLTFEGQLLAKQLGPILDNFRDISNQVRTTSALAKGRIKVSCPFDVGLHLIRHVIPDFHSAYPGVHVSFDFSQRLVDFNSEDFDLAIRAYQKKPKDSDLISVPLAKTTLRIYAAHASPESKFTRLSQLSPARVLTLHGDSHIVKNKNKSSILKPHAPMTLPDMLAVKQATLSEFGAGLLPDFLVEEECRIGILRHICRGWCGDTISFCATYPSRLFLPKRTRIFIDYLKGHFTL